MIYCDITKNHDFHDFMFFILCIVVHVHHFMWKKTFYQSMYTTHCSKICDICLSTPLNVAKDIIDKSMYIKQCGIRFIISLCTALNVTKDILLAYVPKTRAEDKVSVYVHQILWQKALQNFNAFIFCGRSESRMGRVLLSYYSYYIHR